MRIFAPPPIETMKGRDKIAIARVLLILLLTMYGGKALHIHSDSYYSAQTARDSEGNFKDDCTICHFLIFPYVEAETAACQFFSAPLLFLFFASGTHPATPTAVTPSLRAPPLAV